MNRSHAMNVLGLMAARRNACAKAGEDLQHDDPAHVARRDVTALRMAEHLFSVATAEQVKDAETAAPQRPSLDILRLAGRCSNGFEADGGRKFHAVPTGSNRALCGAEPGRRSAGWSAHPGTEVTCPRCRRRFEEDVRPLFLRFSCLLALLGTVRVVDRDARDDARDATAYVWIEHRLDGWAVIEERHYHSDPDVEPRFWASGVTQPQAERCADNLAAHIRAVWADAEAERYGGTSAVTRRAS